MLFWYCWVMSFLSTFKKVWKWFLMNRQVHHTSSSDVQHVRKSRMQMKTKITFKKRHTWRPVWPAYWTWGSANSFKETRRKGPVKFPVMCWVFFFLLLLSFSHGAVETLWTLDSLRWISNKQYTRSRKLLWNSDTVFPLYLQCCAALAWTRL